MMQARPKAIVTGKAREREDEDGTRRPLWQIKLTLSFFKTADQAADLQQKA